MSPQLPSKTEKLAVRVRRVIETNHAETIQMTVFCPSAGRTISVDQCKTCHEYTGIVVDPTERDSFLMCTHSPSSEAKNDPPLARFRKQAQAVSSEALDVPVASIMRRNVWSIRPDVSMDELILRLVEHGISGLPVVDELGKPIGVVSKTDLLWESYEDAELRSERVPSPAANGEENPRPFRTVGEIMNTPPVCVAESAPLAEAAAVMALHGVHRLPVVDETGAVVGIISVGDITAWLAHQAGYVVPPRFPKRR